MTLVVDTGPLISFADATDPRADVVHQVLADERGQLVLPAYVAAEADYMIADRIGREAERGFLLDLASGEFEIEALTAEEHQLVVELDRGHPGMGLTDLSIIVLAARFRTDRVLTFDERDFRTARPLDGDSFVLLPADLP
ncbi:MAG: hypothetical protein ACRDKA_07470 [Actinomycetota bacterium]